MALNKINIKKENGKSFVFCLIRKKWLVLTPEEKVRQFTILQLIEKYHYTATHISVEKQFVFNNIKKRYDIIVFNKQMQMQILIECKATQINLSEQDLKQLFTYNLSLQVPLLMLTNGNSSFVYQIDANEVKALADLPKNEKINV
ncbi:MAG: type I restriction enzyme HsdR N-terminal domain-containing protein [Chitinophagales bacterium]|nr:type I restriction enzyme HsdR N-terminal domain-containing protein [Chitinophagales bacterium]